MGLNKAKGEMYEWITTTWNPLGGACPHNCIYCSTNSLMRYPVIKEKYSGEPRIIEKELTTNLGKDNFIFVVGQNDLFAKNVSDEIIRSILLHCRNFDNKYLFQTKNPKRIIDFVLPKKSVICTTIESDKFYPEIMGNTPTPYDRALHMSILDYPKYVTIEPIMNFTLGTLVNYMQLINPIQINIGADSKHNNLPEPNAIQIKELITELEKFTTVSIKNNLYRLLNK